jgi:hypothetical protein
MCSFALEKQAISPLKSDLRRAELLGYKSMSGDFATVTLHARITAS